ncbi:MAG: hypothetical protein A2Z20_09170 [Bdellovibrionales bacterium RBG_16_40_8]|nr:MAG: hypothetical protein A2Z20_09170 [Bdellovibrionales bacterium RBG_16_40_8]
MLTNIALAENVSAPVAEKSEVILKKHGDTRIDNYFWLKNRDNKKVRDYLELENKYFEKTMAATSKLQSKLVAEMRTRIKEDDESAPYKFGKYFYLTKYEKGAEYPIFARREKSPTGKEEILLNVNLAAKGHKYFDVARFTVSFNQKKAVYAADTMGRRFYDLYFLDLSRETNISDIIKNTAGNVVWMNDNKTILYAKQDPETLRAHQIYKYTIGESPELIYEEKNQQYYVSLEKSLTHNEIYLYSISNSATEARVADANDSHPKFKIFFKREAKHEYSVFDGGDRYFILSNYRAKNFRLFETVKNKTNRKFWRELVARRADTLLENALVLKDYIVLEERKDGLTRLSYFLRGKKKINHLSFPDQAYTTNIGKNAEYDSLFFRYDYQSLSRPATVYDFDFLTGTSVSVKITEVPGYQSDLYNSERIFARAKDGTKIPVSIVYKKGVFKKATQPLYIYAYGSYGYSTDPYFRSEVISLLDRGFVFAIAHVRGGSEMGRKWYDDGKLLKKKNTFTDFVVCTEALIKKGYGKKGHVYALGGSAGGLLIGAVLNMRPDLYNGVVAAVPFVDVVTTMLDDSIPLTTNEYDEWGNPNNKKFYNYIKSYSPYDNVTKQNYPNLLITTGFHDSQVQYWEPAKWIAKLRAHNTNQNLLLMKTNMDTGHSGMTGRFESLKEDAIDYAFFLMLENIKE